MTRPGCGKHMETTHQAGFHSHLQLALIDQALWLIGVSSCERRMEHHIINGLVLYVRDVLMNFMVLKIRC